jgi:hypothetical protein
MSLSTVTASQPSPLIAAICNLSKGIFVLITCFCCQPLRAQDSLSTPRYSHRIRLDVPRILKTGLYVEYGYAIRRRIELIGLIGFRRNVLSVTEGTRNYLRNEVTLPNGTTQTDNRNGNPYDDLDGFDQIISFTAGAGLRTYFVERKKFALYLQPMMQMHYHDGLTVTDTEITIDQVISKAPNDITISQSLIVQTRTVTPKDRRWIGGGQVHLGMQFRINRVTIDLKSGACWNPFNGLKVGDFRQKELLYTSAIQLGYQF